MSTLPSNDPIPGDARTCDAIEHVIIPRARDLGGFEVRRALPAAERQMVGPFIFLDQMGPAEFLLTGGIDVRPHPHIGLATVTYLFEGEIFHRDSLGTALPIRPGELNLMTAGRGIVHSERETTEAKAKTACRRGQRCPKRTRRTRRHSSTSAWTSCRASKARASGSG
jgi:redox-sensitive bicupin YhaK (pirin superfamily)